MLTPAARKLVLTTHLISTLGWAGALAVFLALSIIGLASTNPTSIQSAYVAMAAIAWCVILPLSLASVATGLVQAFGTPWGLLRHYWVMAKMLLTAIATAVLLLKLGPIDDLAAEAARRALEPGDLRDARISMLVHAAGGLVILLAAAVLAVYKPAGVSTSPMPRWAKVCAAVIALLAILVVGMLAGGGHGPHMHRM